MKHICKVDTFFFESTFIIFYIYIHYILYLTIIYIVIVLKHKLTFVIKCKATELKCYSEGNFFIKNILQL